MKTVPSALGVPGPAMDKETPTSSSAYFRSNSDTATDRRSRTPGSTRSVEFHGSGHQPLAQPCPAADHQQGHGHRPHPRPPPSLGRRTFATSHRAR